MIQSDQPMANERLHGAKPARWLWSLLALLLLLGMVAIFLFVLNGATVVPTSWGASGGARHGVGDWINLLAQALLQPVLATGLGALILTRQWGNPIGWLLLAIGATAALSPLLAELTVYGHYTVAAALPGFAVLAWIHNWFWVILFGLVLLTLALFPTGHFLTRRWQWLIGVPLALFVAPMLIAAAIETPMTSAFKVANPFVNQINATVYNLLFAVAVPAMPLTLLMVLAQAIARFRCGDATERQQIKWLAVSLAAMAVVLIVGLVLALGANQQIGAVMVNLSATLPLLGIGIAVLRYRLYDVDLIINRSLVYGSLTLLLGLVYFGSVILLQRVFEAVTGQQSQLAIVISTLAIAALFNLLHTRVQATIDRRFYRRKYDAQQVLAQFAITARDETDMNALAAELARVVQEALQPVQAKIWLQQAGERHRRQAEDAGDRQ